MDKETAMVRAHDLMSRGEAVYLTTVDMDGWPQTRAMLNLRNRERYPNLALVNESSDQDMIQFFTTNTSSGKISQLSGNNKASAYFCIPSEWRGLMIGGEISVVTSEEIKTRIWQKEWTVYYPGGPTDPDYTILKITPKIAKYYEYLDSYTWNPDLR